jgi:hypothetical protein
MLSVRLWLKLLVKKANHVDGFKASFLRGFTAVAIRAIIIYATKSALFGAQ